MSEFITVSRSDESFKQYMLGKVPNKKNMQCIPVKGFNELKFKEQVTFQIIEKSSISIKQWPALFAQLFRVKWLTLTLTPVLTSLAYMSNVGFSYDLLSLVLLVTCVFFSHSCIFILNDFYDHIFGVDSLASKSGTRIIQQAWLTAGQLRRLGFALLFLSVLTGSFLGYLLGFKLIVFGAVGLVMSWVYSYLSKFKRFVGLNGFLINMFMGPFLVLAISWGLFTYVNITLILLGLFFGLLAYICISYRHLENLYLSQKHVGTSIVEYLGFDKAKLFLLALVALIPFVYSALCISGLEQLNSYKNLFLLVPGTFYFYLLYKNLNLKTSMGSSIAFLRDYTAALHCIFGLSLMLFFLL